MAGAATRHLRAGNAQPQTLLILGGTGFLGPPLTEEALRRGWKVTHFNRGKHVAVGVTGVETLIGDRTGQPRWMKEPKITPRRTHPRSVGSRPARM